MLHTVTVGYWEAWGRWWSGEELKDFSLWGVSLLWWARIGKLLQFAGGAVVVLDLVGPERLLRWSRGVQRLAKKVVAATKAWWRFSIPLRFTKFSLASIPFLVLWGVLFVVTGVGTVRRILPDVNTVTKGAVATMLLAGLVVAALLAAICGITAIVIFCLFAVPSRQNASQIDNPTTFIATLVRSRMWKYIPLRRRQANRNFTAILSFWLTFGLIGLLVMNSIGGIVPEFAPWNIPQWLATWIFAIALVWGISQFLSAPVTVLLYAIQLVLSALAHMFRHDNPRQPARWVAFFFVIFGSHFDLLGS